MDLLEPSPNSSRLADPEPPLADLRLRHGDVLDGRYQIMGLLGEGGFGVVYLVEHLTLHKRFALKTIHPQHFTNDLATNKGAAQLLREIKLLAEVSHPNVVSIVDQGLTPAGAPFFVMDYVAGSSLFELVRREGPLAPERVIALGVALCRGVEAAHQRGILHRDIKTNNLMVTLRSGAEHLTILDFGLSKHMDATEFTQAGTPLYIAPEVVIGGKPDRRSDVYSAAVTLYVLATGTYPKGQAIAGVPRTRAPEALPFGLRGAIERGLSFQPEDRFPSMQAFAQALAEGPSIPQKLAWLLGLLVFLVIITLVLALAFGWFSSDEPDHRVYSALRVTPREPDPPALSKPDPPAPVPEPRSPRATPELNSPADWIPYTPASVAPPAPAPEQETKKKPRTPLGPEELQTAKSRFTDIARRSCKNKSELAKVSGNFSVSPSGKITLTWFNFTKVTEPELHACLSKVLKDFGRLRPSSAGRSERLDLFFLP